MRVCAASNPEPVEFLPSRWQTRITAFWTGAAAADTSSTRALEKGSCGTRWALCVWDSYAVQILQMSRSCRAIHTENPVRKQVLALCIISESTCGPFVAAFPVNSIDGLVAYLRVSYVQDIFYLFNICLNMYTLTHDFRYGLIDDPTFLRARYLNSASFKLDVLGLLPTELAVAHRTVVSDPVFLTLRLSRLVRFWRLDKCISNLTSNVRLNSNLVGSRCGCSCSAGGKH